MLPTQVLVIDDEQPLKELMCELVRDKGAHPVAFDTADAALIYLEKYADQTSLIVTDIKMPGILDGYDLARLVFKRWPQMPVILTSGQTALNSASLPANVEFLPKPWSVALFFDTLDRLVRASPNELETES
jgi:DNA-binding NtrC family response regulator